MNRVSNSWPVWSQPNTDEILSLAQIITPYLKFLSLEIVEAIVEDNQKNSPYWTELLLSKGVEPQIYLWEGSPCAFPGIRRHAGNEERKQFTSRNSESIPFVDAIDIDDNTYPKEIWSFIFTGKKFQKCGPENFELAHLFDHKTYKDRNSVDLFGAFPKANERHPYSGLFTCVTNSCYVPESFLKPTDTNNKLRRLMQAKAVDLYKNICNPFPFGLSLGNINIDHQWNIDDFTWGDPVGNLNNIGLFLEYRKMKIESYYKR